MACLERPREFSSDKRFGDQIKLLIGHMKDDYSCCGKKTTTTTNDETCCDDILFYPLFISASLLLISTACKWESVLQLQTYYKYINFIAFVTHHSNPPTLSELFLVLHRLFGFLHGVFYALCTSDLHFKNFKYLMQFFAWTSWQSCKKTMSNMFCTGIKKKRNSSVYSRDRVLGLYHRVQLF